MGLYYIEIGKPKDNHDMSSDDQSRRNEEEWESYYAQNYEKVIENQKALSEDNKTILCQLDTFEAAIKRVGEASVNAHREINGRLDGVEGRLGALEAGLALESEARKSGHAEIIERLDRIERRGR